MIDEKGESTTSTFVPGSGACARLLIEGVDVGQVVVQTWNSSWAFGRFTPNENFARFAPLFGGWSLIMHDDEGEPLHETAADELAKAERRMDALHVEVHFVEQGLRIPSRQLNIDGELVEWKML